MASAVPGGSGIAPGKHPTAERLWAEERRLVCDRCGHDLDWDPTHHETMSELERNKANPKWWYVCKPCLDALPDVPFGTTVYNSEGDPVDIVREP